MPTRMFFRHLLSILLLPFLVTVVVPVWIASPAEAWPLSAGLAVAVGAAGMASALAGGALVVLTIRLFATQGRGTLAPWDPTRRLVVRGVYRHVRNPMITGVFLVLTGEALILRSTTVLLWALLFLAINAVYIPLIEEPGLIRRFGEEYLEYRRSVPRWVPRVGRT